MAVETSTKPIDDSIAKVNDEIAVGEDLRFQRHWWRFEKIAWAFLAIVVALAFAGVFGRGPLSKAHKQSADGSLQVNYDWVERFGTPSIITIHFGRSAIRNGSVQIWVSDSVIKELGNQRVVPQPSTSVTGDAGMAYTFATSNNPDSIELTLEPAKIGQHRFTIRLLGSGTVDHPQAFITASVFVMP